MKLLHVELKNLKCEKCGLSMSTRYDLKQHQIAEHSPFECDQCHYKTGTKDTLRQHYKDHHSGKVNKCEICELVYGSRRAMKQHQKLHKSLDRIRILYRCQLCYLLLDLKKIFFNQTFIETLESAC